MRRAKYYKIVPFIFMLIICLIIFVSGLYAEETKIPPDSVIISGKYYQIEYPWLGHKIGDKSDSIPNNLSMIPREYAYDSSRIFVTEETRAAFISMIKEAEKDGVFFEAKSGFRSYSYQAQIFAGRMNGGQSFERVAKDVAPPGYSEHMLGTAFDLATDTVPFAESKAYRWLKANAAKFGFIESYPEISESGFSWEAWHWRYVGTDNNTLKK